MSRKVFILLGIFVFSRIPFINPLPVFFDSPEYLNRLSNPNYFQAIVTGHMPFHAGYIMLFWPIFRIANFLNLNPSFTVVFMQIIFSALAMYCFYRFTETLTNKRIAIIAAITSSLIPLYWIMNVSIMAESTYINFFLASLFFLSSYAIRKTRLITYLVAGCILFGLALLTNPLVILWLPLFLAVVYIFKKRRLTVILPAIILTTAFVVLINGFFIASAFHIPLQNGIHQYLLGEDINVMPNISSLLAILRFSRNALIPILQNYTAFIFILSAISLIKIFKKNRKLFIIAFLWISPAMITNQWFDPLLFGRHGIISGFGFALLAGMFLEKRKILFSLGIAYLLLVSLPALALLKQPIPYLEMDKFVQTLPKGLLIETHFARPQIEGRYTGAVMFVNQPGWSKDMLKKTIDSYLGNSKPIFVTSQALSDPYGIYSGPFLYPLSLSYAKKFELEDIISSYSLNEYAVVDKNANIIIFKIISKEKSKYPDVPKLNFSRRRMDYFDPLTQLWLLLERAKIIQIQNIIKE